MSDSYLRPRGLRAPYNGDTGSFKIAINLGAEAAMSDVSEVVRGLEALTEFGQAWGTALARTAATWDLRAEIERRGPEAWFELAHEENGRFLNPHRLRWVDRHWGWGIEPPEFSYLRDARASELLGQAPRVRQMTYNNPLELILAGAGLLMAGSVMVARLVRDWSANQRIGQAEARKAEAEARVAEAWADREEITNVAIRVWLNDEALRTDTPFPISEMAAITTQHNFSDLRRLIERPVTLELPPGYDPTASQGE